MPELPEVETVRQILNTFLPKQQIVAVHVYKKRIIRGDVEQFINTLVGRTFGAVERIGKYLIFTFDNDLIMLAHLRMEGRFLHVAKDEENTRYAHVVFTLKDGSRLCYDDSRQFGHMELSTRGTYHQTKALLNVGPEPFTIDPKHLYEKLKTRKTPIKLALLDQKLMSGLGNIYVDEVLYLSKIHPLHPAYQLTFAQVKTLVRQSILVLNAAIAQGGTTVRTYAPANGKQGHFQQELFAYGQKDARCAICQFRIKKIFVGGRGTTFCPHCQQKPGAAKTIAITGQKAAGKSIIAQYLKGQGALVFDSDTLAKELYQDKSIVETLEKKLGVSLTNEGHFDLRLLREHLLTFPQAIKIVNQYIHPRVKEKIKSIIDQNQNKTLYFEVPLVFSVKINELFDYIIGVEVSLERQKENLAKRGQTLGINPDAMYLKNRHRLDYILINDGSIDDLINKFKELKF